MEDDKNDSDEWEEEISKIDSNNDTLGRKKMEDDSDEDSDEWEEEEETFNIPISKIKKRSFSHRLQPYSEKELEAYHQKKLKLVLYPPPREKSADSLRNGNKPVISKKRLAKFGWVLEALGCPTMEDSPSLTTVSTLIPKTVSKYTFGKKYPMIHDDDLILFEHLVKEPILQPCIGMEGTLCTLTTDDRLRPIIGKPIVIHEWELSPILTPIEIGQTYPVFNFEGGKIPLFPKKKESRQQKEGQQQLKKEDEPYRDFVYINGKWCEIKTHFRCGQLEPTVIVPSPHKLDPRQYKPWLQFHLWRAFQSRSSYTVNELEFMFGMKLDIMKDMLLHVADKNNGTEWIRKSSSYPPEPPPISCSVEMYMSAYVRGMQKLHRQGIPYDLACKDTNTILIAYRRAYMFLNACTLFSNDRQQRLENLKLVMRVCENTAWYLSYCFYHLFRKVESPQNEFPENTSMVGFGFGRASSYNGLAAS